MIKYTIYLILSSTSFVFSQANYISKYEKYDYEKSNISYYTKLNENENSLVLKVNDNKFIVYKNDSEIYKVSVGYLSGLVIKKDKIDNLKLIYYRTLLDSLNKINPFKLNETKNNVTNESLEIQDGSNYNLKLMKNNYFVDYNSYEPYEYIKYKAIFFEERTKFINVFKMCSDLFNDNNEEYLKIKRSDTIYLKFPANELIKKLSIVEDKEKYSTKYSFGKQTRNFMVVDMKNKIKIKKYSTANKDKVVSFEFFDLYGFEILKNPKKLIFITEDRELSKNKRQFYKVSHITF
jgi:hypothetical protein